MFKPGFFKIAILVLGLACPVAALAQAAPFSYQGELRSNGQPFNGTVDLEFSLWLHQNSNDAATFLIGSEIKSGVPVVNGLFQVSLIHVGSTTIWGNFTENWLQVTVDPGGSNEQILSPRQHISPAPNAWVSRRGTSYGGAWSVFNAAGQHTFQVYPNGRTTIGSHLDLYSGNADLNSLNRPTIRGSNADNLLLNGGGDGVVSFNFDSGSGGVRFHNGTGSGELMRIQPFGTSGVRVGIGTNNPDSTLHVAGTVRANAFITNTFVAAGGIDLCRATGGGGQSAGQIGDCPSSRRFKTDIVNIENPAALIAALRPVRFNWIESGQPDLGLIAEEVAEVVPELATRNNDGEFQGVNYRHLTAVLVGAWQEQQAEIASQQHEILALRAELQAEREATAARLAALENLLLDSPAVAQGRR